MDLQLTAVFVLVALSSCYLGWRGWRLWRGPKKNCGGGCGCSAAGISEKTKFVAISLEKLNHSQAPPNEEAGHASPSLPK